MQSIQDNIYVQCVNRVLDYIYLHIEDELSLATLASVAGFSDYHFHRIFKSIVGETLNQFVWRVRVERGASMMRANPKMSVSDVAFANGFTSLAGYSRAFKSRFGIAPTKWDRSSPLINENRAESDMPTYRITELEKDRQQFNVTLKRMPKQQVAYIRVHDSYQVDGRIERAYHTLLDWYRRQGGDMDKTTLYGMSVDDPDITPAHLCRFDWCLAIPHDWQEAGDISIRELPECLLATVSMSGGDLQLESKILQYMWRCWLPNSRYQPADLPSMEIYHRLPTMPYDNQWTDLHLDCAIPVKRL